MPSGLDGHVGRKRAVSGPAFGTEITDFTVQDEVKRTKRKRKETKQLGNGWSTRSLKNCDSKSMCTDFQTCHVVSTSASFTSRCISIQLAMILLK
jgi:hypothetical protein